MSHQLPSRSKDLQRLRNDGYDIAIQSGHLLLRQVPYVKSDRTVGRGTLISKLELTNDATDRPKDHVVFWTGEFPCDASGSQLTKLVNESKDRELDKGLVAHHSFSQKPDGGYRDYYQKMTTYAKMLEGPAQIIDPTVTARTFPVVKAEAGESAFVYEDTASSRAGIVSITHKLEKGRIAIVGLGGTGSYILDHVAKTPVVEIHLFDGDTFLLHNAYRSPGAPSEEDLEKKPKKVDYFTGVYSRIKRRIVPHPYNLDEKNVGELKGMDFVFLCFDGPSRRAVVEYLVQNTMAFIDVGMGLHIEGESLAGQARVTTATSTQSDKVMNRIPLANGENNEYDQNIQVSDLNALNAALAVIKWKKLCGFYNDSEGELSTAYVVSANTLINEAKPNEGQKDNP
jgi:molybdopterin/thiamine biosynthesis adenylyltransferase